MCNINLMLHTPKELPQILEIDIWQCLCHRRVMQNWRDPSWPELLFLHGDQLQPVSGQGTNQPAMVYIKDPQLIVSRYITENLEYIFRFFVSKTTLSNLTSSPFKIAYAKNATLCKMFINPWSFRSPQIQKSNFTIRF